jgi:hypothetical protein
VATSHKGAIIAILEREGEHLTRAQRRSRIQLPEKLAEFREGIIGLLNEVPGDRGIVLTSLRCAMEEERFEEFTTLCGATSNAFVTVKYVPVVDTKSVRGRGPMRSLKQYTMFIIYSPMRFMRARNLGQVVVGEEPKAVVRSCNWIVVRRNTRIHGGAYDTGTDTNSLGLFSMLLVQNASHYHSRTIPSSIRAWNRQCHQL